ncbi:MAG: hypothetical protein F6J94_24650 [Moorea sp. SIO1F2]|uniref:hypothetical protein n=1 Tax=Moorena sp. SIO1F2 TaxID=2607819 RepID=UPI0013B62FE7|nr:hypothetical protein [Moorena sp. SIO1F2]NET84988.1 hypothetical protein [Moorena sp. SIO1F2]
MSCTPSDISDYLDGTTLYCILYESLCTSWETELLYLAYRLPIPDFLKKIGQVWLNPILDRIQVLNMPQEQL